MSKRLNPNTLKRIRVERKVDVDELAEWLGTSADRIEKFENGEAMPTIKQLARMSKAFKVPLYSYRADDLPNLEPIPADFRKRQPNEADLSPAGLSRLWSTEQIADFVNEIVGLLGDEAPRRTRLPLSKDEALKDPEKAREIVENWIGRRPTLISQEKSASLTFAKRFRLFIERHGCLVSFNDAPSDDFLGFYKKFNNRTPLAFVNRRSGSQKASLFTLAHEWAHFLSDSEGISDPWEAHNTTERICNQFAAKFLAPENLVKGFIDSVWSISREPTRLVSAVSQHSLLSFRAAAIRLNELDYISKADLREIFRRPYQVSIDIDNEFDPAPERKGGNVYSAAGRRLSEVGIYACVAASRAVEKGLIDDLDVAEGLNISLTLQPYVFEMARKRFELEDA